MKISPETIRPRERSKLKEVVTGIKSMLRVEIQSGLTAATLFCSGRIVLGIEAETLRCLVLARSECSLVLDLNNVYVMDAAGLGLLVELLHRAQERAGSLTIANPSYRVRRLLELTGLHSIITIADSFPTEMLCDEAARQQAMTA
jgi:anti-anti-sigma factor